MIPKRLGYLEDVHRFKGVAGEPVDKPKLPAVLFTRRSHEYLWPTAKYKVPSIYWLTHEDSIGARSQKPKARRLAASR